MSEYFNIKQLTETSTVPFRAHETDAGYDLFADVSNPIVIKSKTRKTIPTGISVDIPNGHYGRIAPRSGLAWLKGIDVLAGVIDIGYRGEIQVILHNTGDQDFLIKRNDKIAQLILTKCSFFPVKIVSKLDETKRGENGFGSTG